MDPFTNIIGRAFDDHIVELDATIRYGQGLIIQGILGVGDRFVRAASTVLGDSYILARPPFD